MITEHKQFQVSGATIHNGSETGDTVAVFSYPDPSVSRFLGLKDLPRLLPQGAHVVWVTDATPMVGDSDGKAIAIVCGVNKVGRGYLGTLAYQPSNPDAESNCDWDPEVGLEEWDRIRHSWPEAWEFCVSLGAFTKAP